MFKRIALTLTFAAALMTAGLSFTTPAQAWRGYYGGGPYARSVYYGGPRYYAGPRGYYYAPYRPYRSYAYYGGPYVVAPPAVPYYAPYYGGPAVYYGSPGVSVSVGL
jgi:hypothetical protein